MSAFAAPVAQLWIVRRLCDFMTTIDTFNLIASITSIVLAIIAIVLSILSDRRASESHQKTVEALNQIDKRAAVTESVVGAQFQQMMETVLSIVKTATADKEIQKAEVIAKGMQGQADVQKQLFGILQEVIQSGDKEKSEAFIKIFESITKSTAHAQTDIQRVA